MSGGERPIGAAKGKQIDTEALCQTPPPSPRLPLPFRHPAPGLWGSGGLQRRESSVQCSSWGTRRPLRSETGTHEAAAHNARR